MNILYISGGITFGMQKYKLGLTYGYRTIRALKAGGHKITLICFAPFTEEEMRLFQPIRGLCSEIIFVKQKIPNRMRNRLQRIYCFITNTWMEDCLSRSKEMRNRIKSIDKPGGFDVAIFDSYSLVKYAGCIKNFPKLLYFGDSITLKVQEILKSATLNIFCRIELLRWMNKIKNFEKNSYTGFTKCIVAAQRDKDTVLELNPGLDITVLPFPVDTEYFKKRAPEDKNVIIFTGILWTEHNADAIHYFCSDILPIIKRKNRNATLLLVGGTARKEIRKLAAMDPNVKLIGFIEDLRPYLDHATVFVSPMRIGSGMNLKVLEAMSMSKAIVTTEYGNRGIGLADGREAIVCRDKYKFADSVIDLLEDEKKRKILGQNARIKAEKEFSIETFSHRLDAIIKNVK